MSPPFKVVLSESTLRVLRTLHLVATEQFQEKICDLENGIFQTPAEEIKFVEKTNQLLNTTGGLADAGDLAELNVGCLQINDGLGEGGIILSTK
jgi:hypothetical protein